MTTTVMGVVKESEIRIVVEDGVEHFPTGNSFKVLFVRGGPTFGEVWLQTQIVVILPLPLPWFRDVTKVDKNNPVGRIWNGNNEYLKVNFTEPADTK